MRSGAVDDDDIDPRAVRRVQNMVRDRRAALDDLERRARWAPDTDEWSRWVRDARTAATRAELQYWAGLLGRVR